MNLPLAVEKKNVKKIFSDYFRKAQNSEDVLKRELVSKFEQIVTKNIQFMITKNLPLISCLANQNGRWKTFIGSVVIL